MSRITITEQLRELVKQSDDSQYRIAKESGVPQQTLSLFARGGGLNGINIDRLAKHFGVALQPIDTGGE